MYMCYSVRCLYLLFRAVDHCFEGKSKDFHNNYMIIKNVKLINRNATSQKYTVATIYISQVFFRMCDFLTYQNYIFTERLPILIALTSRDLAYISTHSKFGCA